MATGRVPTTANSPLTAKGDLFTYSTAPARLAVGSNGETIVADSSTSTGLRYQANFAAGKNKIINGDFGIWQRGTSFANSGNSAYTADRFMNIFDGTGATRAISQQTFTPGTAPVAGYEGKFFFRFNQTVAGTGSSYNILQQCIEDVQTFAGQTISISFWAKSDSSRVLGNVDVLQSFNGSSAVSTSATLTSGSATIGSTWQRVTYSVAVPSITGKTIGASSSLNLRIWLPVNSTFTLDFWGVQVEAGSVATAFQTATGTIQGELAACQRYYEKTYNLADVPGTYTAAGLSATYGGSDAFNNAQITIPMQVAKRNASYSVATYSESGTVSTWNYVRSGASGTFAPTADLKSNRTFRIYGGVGAAYVVVGSTGHWVVDNEL